MKTLGRRAAIGALADFLLAGFRRVRPITSRHFGLAGAWLPLFALLVCLLAFAAAAAEKLGELTIDPGGKSIAIDKLGPAVLEQIGKLSDEDRSKALQLFVQSDLADPPPVAGSVTVVSGRLVLTPRYPLVPGTRYLVIQKPPLVARPTALAFQFGEKKLGKPGRVSAIYPSADRLPENLLRFYIHFSKPMSRGEAYSHIHLLGPDGKADDAAFLELGEELWDNSHTRFTLLCDPGRVKRGLKPREELGSVLHAGKDYTLVVDAAWHDASGRPLADSFQKKFHVIAPVEAPIDTAQWHLEAPAAQTLEPVTLRFDRPLDRALVERLFEIVDGKGQPIAGRAEVDEHEMGWRFTPSEKWVAGDHQVVVPTVLEDPSGNRIGRAFEVDEFPAVQQSITQKSISLPFRVK